MQPKLIHLHLPKTGGTSQRFVLQDLYGGDDIFWFGIDDEPGNGFQYEQVAPFRVLGGHKPINFYPAELLALYTAVVRDPVSRVASLYSYYAKPELAQGQSSDRLDNYQVWQNRGMDSESIIKSLEQCEEFRNQVLNFQCRFLSRYTPDFQGARRTLEESTCLVCTESMTGALNSTLGALLNWRLIPQQTLNRSKSNSLELILAEPGAQQAIEELVQEDNELYRYITDTHDGLLDNSLSAQPWAEALEVAAEMESKLIWNQVNVYGKGYVGLDHNGRGTTGIIVTNNGNMDISTENYPGLALDYRVVNIEGETLNKAPLRDSLDQIIPARGRLSHNLSVAIPPELLPKAARIHVGLVLENNELVEYTNPLHAASTDIIHL